ncbi:MAG: hypothetical protein K0U34_08795, partial [Alphaproteobacteria bacterium]|nr:hypothetical protein [Alphaproteobacteria bacterium]
KKSAPAKDQAVKWHTFLVDVWLTDLNTTEFGLFKRQRNRGKSRQFTSDMDIFAEVQDDGERTGLLGYREDVWKDATGMDKRLVFKLFTPKLGWKATMDLMLGRSLQQTLGARGLPVMTFSINTDDDQYIIYLERSANKWMFMPENYSFFLVDDKGDPEFYRLRRRFIDLGGDYVLYDHLGEKVGSIDGKMFSIGGKWKGKVKAGHHADKRLLTVLKLFTGVIFFDNDVKWHMRTLYRAAKRGKLEMKLERQENDLYLNPRRVR